MNEKIKIICVVGPTASGKTGLGIEIAKKFGGEIISADSMQIYKDMHIASAAPDTTEMQGIKHHLVEFLPYGTVYTVYDWVLAAREKIKEINSKGKVPVIVGGTGLYVNCLVDNIELLSAKTDLNLRDSLQKRAEQEGGAALLEELRKVDPEEAAKLHENDIKRIIRSLEIYKTSGITKTEQNFNSKANESPFSATIIGIKFEDRQKLYERINLRVDKMFESGLICEAQRAYSKRNELSAGAIQAIGHKELFPYFNGEISLLEAAENLKRATRRYAKRQLTWFNAREDINWVYPDKEDIFKKSSEILGKAKENEGT